MNYPPYRDRLAAPPLPPPSPENDLDVLKSIRAESQRHTKLLKSINSTLNIIGVIVLIVFVTGIVSGMLTYAQYNAAREAAETHLRESAAELQRTLRNLD